MKHVKLVQMDGKLPNLALMKLAHWHLEQGDEVMLSRFVQRTLFERNKFDLVYASAIFSHSAPRLEELRGVHPDAIIGGTGAGGDLSLTVEQTLGTSDYEHYDYSIYPEYPWSLGFTQRGCRLNCGFCVVPKKEGRPKDGEHDHEASGVPTRNVASCSWTTTSSASPRSNGRPGSMNSGRDASRSTSARAST